ncbi:MAG: phosphatase domain-containing protein [Ginsengibacter sp.]
MQNSFDLHKVKQISFLKRFKRKLLFWFRLTNVPVLKVYNGYGNQQTLVIFGHVLNLSSLPRQTYRKNLLTNFFSMLRLFMVKASPCMTVKLEWAGITYKAESEDDGFFRFEWTPGGVVKPGKHEVKLNLLDKAASVIAEATGHIYVPDEYKYAIISDIDDTFLISHSSNLRRRLYVLLTKNAHSRRPFEGVVNHYKLLANAGLKTGAKNPFFYVSSSEWNLYEFLLEFSRKHELPEGVFLLSQLKKLSQVLATGQGKHATKFMRIARIVEAFPNQQLILLGDDSQKDPEIYLSLIEHFQRKINCVYIRKTFRKNYTAVKEIVEKIEKAGVPCCYFEHSAEAIIHSKEIGLSESI